MESLAAVAGSLLLLASGAALGLHRVREILALQGSTHLGNAPAGFTLIVLLATIVLKDGLFRWVRTAKRSKARLFRRTHGTIVRMR